ncbi:MAG: hypothetical protein ACOYXC_06895 [Candidatus Rifleibacteriota bacterium]
MYKNLKKLIAALAMTVVASFPLQGQGLLEQYNLAQINEVRFVERSISHKENLVITINQFLDCAAAGRIETALIGWNEVPAHIVSTWQRQNESVEEVSISRYSLELAGKIGHDRTDYYGFRALTSDQKIVETLIKNESSDNKASVIAKYVDGDAFGKFKSLSSLLDELKSFIEEGQITSANVDFHNVTQRVNDLWKNNCGVDLYEVVPSVKKYEINCPSGIEYIWRVTGRLEGTQTQIMIFRNRLVYISRDGQIEVK